MQSVETEGNGTSLVESSREQELLNKYRDFGCA